MEQYKLIHSLVDSDIQATSYFTSDGVYWGAFDGGLSIGVQAADRQARYGLEKFSIFPMWSPFQGMRQWSEIRIRGSTNTVGYTFPITSLLEGDHVDAGWPEEYCAAAISWVIKSGGLNDFVERPAIEVGQVFDIDSLFPSGMSIVVLGKEQQEDFSIDENEAAVMLHQHGFRLFPDKQEDAGDSIAMHEQRIKLQRVSVDLRDEVASVRWVFKNGFNERNSVARFLAFYQVLEVLIAKIFENRIQGLVASVGSGGMSSWEVRDKLSELVREKSRLDHLVDSCLPGVERQIFNECCEACKEVLRNIEGEAPDACNGWAEAVYRVRNLMVHRQPYLSRVSEADRRRVSELLGECCLHMLAAFSPT